jgi:ribosomal protein S18 acetylase RimI-like enzyme
MNEDILSQIEANMRAVGRQERLVVARPYFHLFISPQALDHLTFATPLPGEPADWTDAVADMVAVFAQHGKRPRLEFIADLHPHLPAALEQAGLVCESRAPVMVWQASGLAPAPNPQPQMHYRRLTAENETLLKAHLIQQSIAFGGTGEDEDALGWLPNLQRGLADGLVMGAVLEQATLLKQGGELLSGAVIQMGEGPGELAGVWTAPQWRSRGLAFALCRQLLAEYTALGHTTCWLSAAEGAQRLYEKLGFVCVGTQLNYGGTLPR